MALKLPRKPADFIIRATTIHDTIEANPKTIPSPNPLPAVLKTHIDDLVAKEALAKTRAAGAVSDRDAAMKIVGVDLNNERAYVEQLVNADPTNAATIAQDAGMMLRKVPSHNKSDLAVKHGIVSGQIHVVAKATKGAKVNEWQYSADGGKTWLDLPKTGKATTTVQNLVPGITVTFRHRVYLTKTGDGDWSQPVSAIVI